MKPAIVNAIELAQDLYEYFQPAEIIDEDTEEIQWHEPVIPLSAVIKILKKYGLPEPDFKAWAKTLTEGKIKSNNRIRFKVSQKIQAAMREKGITQTDLAHLVNKLPSQINHLLSGENMTLETLNMFQEVLGINLLDLS